MITFEGLRLKILKYNRKFFGNKHQKAIKNKKFTIISNNCWGGEVYEYYNLPKQSPTVGMFFMADDYIRFLSHLKEYLNAKITFINPNDSKWKENPIVNGDKRWGTYPIGKLEIQINKDEATEQKTVNESVEVFFLHYHNEQEAKEKWIRRINRINWGHLLVKFNDQNGCTEKHLREFDALSFEHKIFFSVTSHPDSKNVVCIKAPGSHKFIRASYEPFGSSKYCNIDNLINEL